MYNILRTIAANTCGEGSVSTAIIGNGGCYSEGIYGILGLGIDILTLLIGAASVIGLIISGIQYATASGEPATVTKAKRRIIEIVIGIALYGLFYAIMRFLIPAWD